MVLPRTVLTLALLLLLLALGVSACDSEEDKQQPSVCEPFTTICVDNEVFRCRTDGSRRDYLETCPEHMPCVNGHCTLFPTDATTFDIVDPPLDSFADKLAPDSVAVEDTLPDLNTPDVPDVHLDLIVPPDVSDVHLDLIVPPDAEEDLPPALCGNGNLDFGEKCDPSIPSGAGACPSECPPSEGCTQWELLGNSGTCDAECRSGPITLIGPSDGCCPPGGNALTDSDCTPDCGNQVTEPPGEECDGTSVATSCQDMGYPGGDMLCDDDCQLDSSLCGESFGMLVHEKVPNLLFQGDFVDVDWHPDGSSALLLLSSGNKLVKYDPEANALSLLYEFTGALQVTRVAYHPSGDFAFVVGYTASEPRMWKVFPETGEVVEHNLATYAGLKLTVVKFDKSGDRVAFGGYLDTDVTHLFVSSTPFESVSMSQGYGDYRGLADILWAEPDPLVYDGADYLLTSEGTNGAHSRSWILDVDTVVENGWSNGFGNPGRGQCQPGGIFCFVAARTTGKVYVWDQGDWPYPSMSVPGSGSNISSVAWNENGTRALVVGRPSGNPVKGTVVEFRLNPGASPDQGQWIDQSIPAWGEAPYLADFNTSINHVAWRPNSPCQEGLIVASDTGTSWSPGFGIVVHFKDSSDPDCL